MPATEIIFQNNRENSEVKLFLQKKFNLLGRDFVNNAFKKDLTRF